MAIDPRPFELPLAERRCERIDAAANRERVLRAARRLFRERGSDGVSMDAVAEAAGVGKGTVFRRFGDRAGLMEALLDDGMREFQDCFLHGPPPLGPGADPGTRLRSFLHELVAVLDRNIDLVLAAELPSTHPPAVFEALALHLRLLLAELAPAANAEILADLLLSAVSAPMIDRVRRGRGYELADVCAAIDDLLEGLLCSGEGSAA